MCEMCVIMSTLVIHLLLYILRRLAVLKFSIFGVVHLGCVKESGNKLGSIRLKIKGGEGGREKRRMKNHCRTIMTCLILPKNLTTKSALFMRIKMHLVFLFG